MLSERQETSEISYAYSSSVSNSLFREGKPSRFSVVIIQLSKVKKLSVLTDKSSSSLAGQSVGEGRAA